VGMKLDYVKGSVANGTIKLNTDFLKRHSTTVVIQEVPTRRYWVGNGVWTSDIDQAAQFDTCSGAQEQAMHFKLANVQLVLAREITEYETIPLKATFRS